MDENTFKTQAAHSEGDVISFYDHYAKTWDVRFKPSYATAHFLRRRWDSFFSILEKSGSQRGSAIELGVGTGVYIASSATLFKEVLAVDGSEKMLSELQQKLKDNNISNVSTRQLNVTELSGVNNDQADCVYFFGLLEHILNTDEFAKEIHRVLKPGGVLIGVTPNKNSPWYKMRQIIRGTGAHCSTDRLFSSRDIDALFIPKGMKKIQHLHWGAVPAGIHACIGRPLAFAERILERTPLRYFLGGITFAYAKETQPS